MKYYDNKKCIWDELWEFTIYIYVHVSVFIIVYWASLQSYFCVAVMTMTYNFVKLTASRCTVIFIQNIFSEISNVIQWYECKKRIVWHSSKPPNSKSDWKVLWSRFSDLSILGIFTDSHFESQLVKVKLCASEHICSIVRYCFRSFKQL